jgi:Na+-translocating ferredoxin:NAD+ oxidoreductase RnfD subunit
LQSGSLLIFAFFMISDPRTTPDSRLGRCVFAISVALLGHYLARERGRQRHERHQRGTCFELRCLSPGHCCAP